MVTSRVLQTEAALLALGTRDRSCDAKADVAGDDGRPLAAKLEARDEASVAFFADTQRDDERMTEGYGRMILRQENTLAGESFLI